MAEGGDWLVAEELFERGEGAFVDAIRGIDDADRLGGFAARWFGDRRPEARRLLQDYLDRPLNAFRHEALVKRLFKRAEAAGDDLVMAWFLVAFDRTVRRVVRTVHRRPMQELDDERTANLVAAQWSEAGYESVGVWKNWRGKYQVWGLRTEPVVTMPHRTTMPRGALRETYDAYSWDRMLGRYRTFEVPDWVFALRLPTREFRKGEPIPEARRKDLKRFRLFSVATRIYLRRRAWRYFRKLGKTHPERYVPAVVEALRLYRDEDAADGLALLDNWGLVHILFRFSPVLDLGQRDWRVAQDRSLEDLEPAPRYAKLWLSAPRGVVDLIVGARSRPVRSWALKMAERNPAGVAAVLPLEERLALLAHEDPAVVAFAARLLRDDPALAEVPASVWLNLVRSASPAALDLLCELARAHVRPAELPLAELVGLASARPLPVARMGLDWLRTRTPRDEAEAKSLLTLVEAECAPLRAEIVAWARQVLGGSAWFEPGWVLAWLDSRHEDVRREGWRWLLDEPRVRDDVTTWQRLLESPYDDVRFALVGYLEGQARGVGADGPRLDGGALDPERVRLLWATVLLNIERGGRTKPAVIRQLVRRAEGHPDDLAALLPLLAVALRSVRGPEFRAGLAAVVRLLTRDERSAGLVRQAFPELQPA
jgi:hypothetical protein